MNQNLTEVVVVLDRSGSMMSCRSETESGLNAFIKEQQAIPGDVNFSLYVFNHDITKVHYREPIRNIEEVSFNPEGYTALHDAIGTAITEIGNSLSGTPEEERPNLVTVMIVTDGHENNSKRFTASRIKSMIEAQRDVYNWKFTFFGANQDAVLKGAELGLQEKDSVDFASGKAGTLFCNYSGKMSAVRTSGVSSHLDYNSLDKADLK